MLFQTVPGKLYVIGEEDIFGGVTSPYFKIGIVRDDREAESRLREHQTGNPRRLVIRALIDAAAVEYLETSLHHRLATKVAYSEWFRLSDEEYASLVSLAHSLSRELEQQVPLVERANLLEKVASNGVILEPDSALTALHESLLPRTLATRKIETTLKTIATTIRTRHVQAPVEQVPAAGGARTILVNSSSFDQKLFMDENPEIAAKYQKTKVEGRFTFAKHAEIDAEAKNLDPLGDYLGLKEADVEHLSDKELELARRQLDEKNAVVGWDSVHHQAATRNAVGEHDGIVGVANWKRVEKSIFDASAFKAAEPELHAKYVTTKQVERLVQGNQGLADETVEE